MAIFKDNNDFSWTVNVNVSTLKRVRDTLGVDLVNDPDAKNLSTLADDEIALVDAIYLICQEQANAREISDEAFGEAMAGDAIAQAAEALLDGLANFFQSPSKRRAIKIMQKTAAKIEAAMQTKLASPEMETAINQAISGKLSTNLQASSASTPQV